MFRQFCEGCSEHKDPDGFQNCHFCEEEYCDDCYSKFNKCDGCGESYCSNHDFEMCHECDSTLCDRCMDDHKCESDDDDDVALPLQNLTISGV